MPSDIYARLYDDDTDFYFKSPVWHLNRPAASVTSRSKVVRTNKGFKRYAQREDPSTITLSGVYCPIFKILVRQNIQNVTSPWDEDLVLPNAVLYHGWNSLLRLVGTNKVFRYGGVDKGLYYVSSVNETVDGQTLDSYRTGRPEESEGAFPQFIDFTIRLEAAEPGAGRPPPEA